MYNVTMVLCLKVSPDEVADKILSLINDGFLQHVIGPALFQVCTLMQKIVMAKLYYCRSQNKPLCFQLLI